MQFSQKLQIDINIITILCLPWSYVTWIDSSRLYSICPFECSRCVLCGAYSMAFVRPVVVDVALVMQSNDCRTEMVGKSLGGFDKLCFATLISWKPISAHIVHIFIDQPTTVTIWWENYYGTWVTWKKWDIVALVFQWNRKCDTNSRRWKHFRFTLTTNFRDNLIRICLIRICLIRIYLIRIYLSRIQAKAKKEPFR